MYHVGTKLGVKEFFYTHVGRHYGNGMVFHNYWRNGAELITLKQFSNGKEIVELDSGVDDTFVFYNRVQRMLDNQKQYSLTSYNCEHAESYAGNGVAKSPQLMLYGLLGLCAVGAYALSKKG